MRVGGTQCAFSVLRTIVEQCLSCLVNVVSVDTVDRLWTDCGHWVCRYVVCGVVDVCVCGIECVYVVLYV